MYSATEINVECLSGLKCTFAPVSNSLRQAICSVIFWDRCCSRWFLSIRLCNFSPSSSEMEGTVLRDLFLHAELVVGPHWGASWVMDALLVTATLETGFGKARVNFIGAMAKGWFSLAVNTERVITSPSSALGSCCWVRFGALLCCWTGAGIW